MWLSRPPPRHRPRCGRSSPRSRGWVDRLGAVWVEGQVAQVSRRPGARHRLHDAARHRGRHLRPGHLRTGALRQPGPAAGRGRQRRPARQALLLRQPRHPVAGWPARSGWSGWASCWPGSSDAVSCWPPRASSPPSSSAALPFLPRLRRAGHRPGVRGRARRARQRPAALARRSTSRWCTRPCRARARPSR